MKATHLPAAPTTRAKYTKRKQRPRRKRPTVLIVDDHPLVRETVKEFLGLELDLACRVIVAETSEQALGLAEHNAVNVVVSDLKRPGMDGFRFLEVFKLAHPNTPVIIFSAAVPGDSERRAYQLGAFRCLSKGKLKELVNLVREVVEPRMAPKVRGGVDAPPG